MKNSQLFKLSPFLVVLFLCTISSLMTLFHFISVQDAIIHASQPQLTKLVSLRDYLGVTRQLDNLLEESDHISYLLYEKNTLILKNINHFQGDFFDIPSFSYILNKQNNIYDKEKELNLTLETFSLIPLAPFLFIFSLYILVYFLYLYYIKNVAIDTRDETTRHIIHNIDSKAKTLLKHIMQLKKTQILSDTDNILEKLSLGIVDTLNSERRRNLLASDRKSNVTDLRGLILDLLSNKRIEYGEKNIIFNYIKRDKSEIPVLSISSVMLDTILSNLINNCVHAMNKNQGHIIIESQVNKNQVIIKIIDNGHGINEESIEQIFNKSYSEKNSTGIGLYHAKNKLNLIGGHIQVESTSQNGTTISITIPIKAKPSWHIEKLELSHINEVIVIDDEKYILDDWKEKLIRFNVETLYFNSFSKAGKWIINQTNLNKCLFLVDKDVRGVTQDGIDFIYNFNIINKSILVSNNADNQNTKKRCELMGLKLLHKRQLDDLGFTHSSYISKFKINSNDQIIYLDDDLLHREIWKKHALKKKINLITYAHSKELLNNLSSFHPEKTIFFLDQNLSNNIKGSDISRNLLEKDFHLTFCVTANQEKDIKDVESFLAVLEKDFPPFL